ncbi:MAG: prepilin-type N-terminal cleavage/methylation domain-containing protein [Thiotrichaceae bacterium]|nr:prepilin-type N-terminal cleavage/methylation domain-containing protein [Thiotrichaceae bacterium]
MRQQSGFTLVEIAIVLVIIGLLLGGVLKGQEIITNAKIKNLESDFNGISAAIYSYQDRYRAIPGDDKNAATRWTGTGVTSGDGNSKIALGNTIHKFDSATAGEESRLFWLHLRNAGLVTGAKTSQDQPLNAFGGITGVSNDSTANGSTAGTTIPGLFVGFTQIPGNIAVILETQSDDQLANTGSIRSDQSDYTANNGSSLVLHKLFFAL